jgi:hypothetical protein
VHHGKRPHHHISLLPPAAAAAAAVFIKNADVPRKNGKYKESAVQKPDKVTFVSIAE